MTAVAATVVVAAIALSTTSRAAVHGVGLRPVPCPQAAWQKDDAAFEALPGARAWFGAYDGGLYRMEIPYKWNGEFVFWAHGFVDHRSKEGTHLRVGFPGAGQLGEGPTFREHLIANGFGWAASSYRCNGYVPGRGLLDTRLLLGVFTKFDGRPIRRTYLAGASMGGHITILGMQEFPMDFAGALAMCPSGAAEMDFLSEVGAASERITGVKVADETRDQDVARLNEIVGVPPKYTDKGRQLASAEIEMTGGPRPFAMEGLASRFTQNVSAAAALLAQPPWNDAAAKARYDESTPFDGRIQHPLMTMHGTGDLYVPVTLERTLKRAVDGAGASQFLVQRLMRIAGHCGFSRAEQAQSFDALVKWVRDGAKPDGDDVMGDLSNAGVTFTSPLRPGDPGTLKP